VTDADAPLAPAARPVAPFGEPLVDVHVVAAYFACDEATVYRLARRAALPAIEVAPRVLRFRPNDVRAFLEERVRRAAPRGRVKRLLGTTP
jgi:helix-turn-helix protein